MKISHKEKNRIKNLHESYRGWNGSLIKEQTTEKWVVNSAGKNVGTFDSTRKLKFIVTGDGKKEGLESGPAIPSGTKLGTPTSDSDETTGPRMGRGEEEVNEHGELPTVRRSEKDMLRRRPYSPKARFKAGL